MLSRCCCRLHGYLMPVLGRYLFCMCFAASLSAAFTAHPATCLALPLLLHLSNGSSIASRAQDAVCLPLASASLLLHCLCLVFLHVTILSRSTKIRLAMTPLKKSFTEPTTAMPEEGIEEAVSQAAHSLSWRVCWNSQNRGLHHHRKCPHINGGVHVHQPHIVAFLSVTSGGTALPLVKKFAQ